MVLVMVDFHGASVNMGFQRIKGVG
jgi:hypothetical protein